MGRCGGPSGFSTGTKPILVIKGAPAIGTAAIRVDHYYLPNSLEWHLLQLLCALCIVALYYLVPMPNVEPFILGNAFSPTLPLRVKLTYFLKLI